MTYEEDNTIENHSSKDNILAQDLPSIAEEEDDDMEEHFPTISLMTIFGWKNLFQRGTCAYMKMPNMVYALIYVHTI